MEYWDMGSKLHAFYCKKWMNVIGQFLTSAALPRGERKLYKTDKGPGGSVRK
jgi:hypothetical protein